MRILDRHVLKTFARLVLLTQAAFTGIYLLIDIFEKVDDFIEHQASLGDCLLYFAHKVPLVINQTIPMTILLATFLTLGSFSRTNELTAMRAGGLSLTRIAMPLFISALVITLGVITFNETVLPFHTKRMNEIFNHQIKKKPLETHRLENIWFREDDRIIHIGLANPDGAQIQNLSIFEFSPSFELLSRLDAPKALASQDQWSAPESIKRSFDSEKGTLLESLAMQHKIVPLSQSAQQLRESSPRPEEMGFFQLRELTRKLRKEGYNAVRYQVDMHSRLSTPFANLIMVFLAVPFALARGRGSSPAVGVSISIAIGIAYHMLQALMLAFGYSEALPALLAAWSPNTIFLLFGCWLMLNKRQ